MVDIFGRYDRQRQRVRDAARAVASRAGDIAAEEYLISYYKAQAEATDPHVDWWTYADVRQKQQDHENDLEIARRRHGDAQARLTAQQLKLEKMK